MTEEEFCDWLTEQVQNYEYGSIAPERISTFKEAGVLTRNEGLVFRLTDGSEFQVTVVKAR